MKKEKKKSISNFIGSSPLVRGGLLVVVMCIFTVILHPNLIVTEHSYQLGDVAERDIKAPRDFFIEDKKAGDAARQEAADKVLTVYDRDATFLSRLKQQLTEAFDEFRKLLESEEGDQLNVKESETDSKELPDTVPGTEAAPEKSSARNRLWQKKSDFEKKFGFTVSEEDFNILRKGGFSKNISDVIIRILTEILENGVVANKEVLLRESDKGIVLRDLGTETEDVVRTLKKFYGPEQYKEMVRIVAKPLIKDISKALVPVIVSLSQKLIQPNITLNRSETEERRKKAVAGVNPILHLIKAGEMILREGDITTESQLHKLEKLDTGKIGEKIYVRSIGAMVMILCLLIITYMLHVNRQNQISPRHNKDMLFISVILVSFFFLPRISAILFESLSQNWMFSISASSLSFGIPLAASAMTVCLFMKLNAAISFAIVISVCTALIFQNRFEIFLYFLMNCIMGAYWIQNCKERKVFIMAGVRLGMLNMILATAADVYTGDYSGAKLLWDWGFAFAGGLGAGIVAAGLAPLLEMAFDYTTDVTLHELANLDRPILRKLMMEAPGTYHHSVVIGSMVEAAASEIGANPLLAKVCGYYHDIGKVKKPVYFVENQSDGKNRHDKLAPSMSALILISHVKDGVEIGRQNKLGQVIIDTIQQHHGTSLIRFFYEKAKQLKGKDAVKIEDFRYPGPKPQTREAGLVMLADVVEAASRTLDNPTPSRIQGHVQKLINGIFADGQLDNCELTLRDLHNIAKSFNKILNGIHHHRIEYPEKPAAGAEKEGKKEKKKKKGEENKENKEKNGSVDQQPANQPKDTSGRNKEDVSGRLKRLGVS